MTAACVADGVEDMFERYIAKKQTCEAECSREESGVQDLVMHTHLVAPEQLGLKRGGEAVSHEVSKHQKHTPKARMAGLARCF